MEINFGSDGGKSCHVTLSGLLSESFPAPEPILLFKDLKESNGRPITKLKLDGIQFAIQEKMGFSLWWIMPPDKGIPAYKLILPIESRGGFDFEKIKSIQSPEGALGIALTSFRVTESDMAFMIMLDFSK